MSSAAPSASAISSSFLATSAPAVTTTSTSAFVVPTSFPVAAATTGDLKKVPTNSTLGWDSPMPQPVTPICAAWDGTLTDFCCSAIGGVNGSFNKVPMCNVDTGKESQFTACVAGNAGGSSNYSHCTVYDPKWLSAAPGPSVPSKLRLGVAFAIIAAAAITAL